MNETVTKDDGKIEFESTMRSGLRASFLASILVMLILQLPIAGFLAPGTSTLAQVGHEGIFWLLTASLVAYVLFVERCRFSSIGLVRPSWKSVAFGVAGALTMIAGIAFIYIVIFPAFNLGSEDGEIATITALPLWFRIALVTRAAVFEEIFYRGFVIERLSEMTSLRWLAALISLVAFTFAHLDYWGWSHLIVALTGGAVLTGLYLFRRDLASNMIAHFLTDAIAFWSNNQHRDE